MIPHLLEGNMCEAAGELVHFVKPPCEFQVPHAPTFEPLGLEWLGATCDALFPSDVLNQSPACRGA